MARAYSNLDPDYQRMIDETSAFITRGLRHPDRVRWIPTRPIGQGGFSERLSFVFWTPFLGEATSRPLNWLRRLIG